MTWKPFCRLCAACGLSLVVVVGEGHEHVHVETQTPISFRANNLIVAATSAAFIALETSPVSSKK